LQFYVFERVPEVLARHMLLLSLATDWELPIRTRAHLWLEVFGNSMVQARTAAYLSRRRLMLIDLLCSGRGPAPLPALLDAYSLLRHRQRDEVESVLKTWAEEVAFDMPLYRDTRVRAHQGARYDSLDNVGDWDYQTVIKPCAGAVHGKQYRAWRAGGIAFEYGDQTYDRPNRTLGSYAEGKARKRGSVMARGFWGDLVVSPFHALGTAAYVPTDAEARAVAALPGAPAAADAAAAPSSTGSSGGSSTRGGKKAPHVANFAASLFDVLNRKYGSEQWRHHAVEVATYNLLAWLTEMETGRAYIMRTDNDIYSGLPPGAGAAAAAAAAAEASGDTSSPPLSPPPPPAEGGIGSAATPPPAAAAEQEGLDSSHATGTTTTTTTSTTTTTTISPRGCGATTLPTSTSGGWMGW